MWYNSLWFWRCLPHRLSKCQSLSTTILFGSTLTRTITFQVLMKCFSLVVFRVLEACKSWTQFLHGLTSWITWHKFLFTHQNFHHSFINPRDDRCGSIYYNKQRLYKESIWRQNYSKYGNFCDLRQGNCSEKKRDINDEENRCQWVSNNILTTYRTVL